MLLVSRKSETMYQNVIQNIYSFNLSKMNRKQILKKDSQQGGKLLNPKLHFLPHEKK